MDRLFDAGVPIRAYDASSDGQQFRINVPAGHAAQTSVTIIVGWPH